MDYCQPNDAYTTTQVVDGYHTGYNAHDGAAMAARVLQNAQIRVHGGGEIYPLTPEEVLQTLIGEGFGGGGATVQVLNRWTEGAYTSDRIYYYVDFDTQQNFLLVTRVEAGCIAEMDFFYLD